MQTQPPDAERFPAQPAPVSADADLAREVALRLERWYAQRGLQLPPEVQAGFTEMGVEAVVRDRVRAREDVLDELIAELDASLARIHAEPGSAPAVQARPWWRRLFGGAR